MQHPINNDHPGIAKCASGDTTCESYPQYMRGTAMEMCSTCAPLRALTNKKVANLLLGGAMRMPKRNKRTNTKRRRLVWDDLKQAALPRRAQDPLATVDRRKAFKFCTIIIISSIDAGYTMAQSFMINSAIRMHPEEFQVGVGAGAAAAEMAVGARELKSTRELLEPSIVKAVQARILKHAPLKRSKNNAAGPKASRAAAGGGGRGGEI